MNSFTIETETSDGTLYTTIMEDWDGVLGSVEISTRKSSASTARQASVLSATLTRAIANGASIDDLIVVCSSQTPSGDAASEGVRAALLKYRAIKAKQSATSVTGQDAPDISASTPAPARAHAGATSVTREGAELAHAISGPFEGSVPAASTLSRLANVVLFLGVPAGLLFGAVNHGFAGALSGAATAFWSSVMLKVGMRPQVPSKNLTLVGVLLVLVGAYIGGWQWGWATTLGGVVAAISAVRLFESRRGRL